MMNNDNPPEITPDLTHRSPPVDNAVVQVHFDSSMLISEISELIDDIECALDPVLMPNNGTTPGVIDDESIIIASLYVIKQKLEKIKQRIHI